MGQGDTAINAIIGAVVTVLFSFTGFSPVIGGAVAGYLQGESPRRGAKVGALSGAIAFLPFFFILFLVFGVMFGMLGGMGLPGGPELLVIGFLVIPFVVLWNVGLGALGGYLGTYLYDEFSA